MENKVTTREMAWLVISILCVLLGSVIKNFRESENLVFSIISCIASICGIVYVFFIAKGARAAYIPGIVYCVMYGGISFFTGIYANAVYNICYALPMFVFGYIKWGKVANEENSGIKTLTNKQKAFGGIGVILAIGIVALISNSFGGEQAVLDSMTTVLLAVSVWLMANKYIEQWTMFIAANLIGTIMFVLINLGNMQKIELLLMWIIYLINSVYGAIVWQKMYKQK